MGTPRSPVETPRSPDLCAGQKGGGPARSLAQGAVQKNVARRKPRLKSGDVYGVMITPCPQFATRIWASERSEREEKC